MIGLGNVAPGYSQCHLFHRVEIEPKLVRDFLIVKAFRSHAPYVHDIIDSQSGPTMTLANRMVASPSVFPIRGILFLRAKIEMLWVAAGRIIAFMKNVHSRNDGNAREDQCHPMRWLRDAIVSYFPITPHIYATLPYPTRFRASAFVNGIPKIVDAGSDYWEPVQERDLVVKLAITPCVIRSLAVLHGTHFAGLSHVEPLARLVRVGGCSCKSAIHSIIQRITAMCNMRCAGTVTPSVAP
jgi:hypothetical protein